MGTEHSRIRRKNSDSKRQAKTNVAPPINAATNMNDLHRLLGNQGIQRLISEGHDQPDVQREEKKLDDSEAYKKAGEKAVEAIKETEPVKQIIEKAKQEGLAFVATLHGAMISGATLLTLLTALHLSNTSLPISEFPIPLEKLDKSLKDLELKVEYKSDGSPLKPESVMVTFVYTPGKAAAENERKKKAKQKLEEEIIALRKSQEQFREMMMTPDERKREQEMLMQALNSVLFPKIPDIKHSPETAKDVQKEMPNLLKMR